MSETLTLRATLEGHSGWITSLATSPESPHLLLSGSRDKSLLIWRINNTASGEDDYATPQKRMTGHAGFVQDCVISSDGQFALSASWDKTLRLWNLAEGKATCRFVGHSKDVLSVSFSPDNRQIVSGGRDKCIKLWNTIGDCKFDFGVGSGGHSEWVSCVRFSPNPVNPLIVSGGWDRLVKVSLLFFIIGYYYWLLLYT